MRKPIEDRVLYEDNHLLIVNKLPSEIVQGDKTGDVCLLDDVKSYIKETYNKPGNVFAGLVHRINRHELARHIGIKTAKRLLGLYYLGKTDIHKLRVTLRAY